MKKIDKNAIINQIVNEVVSKYIQESAGIIAKQMCSNCPLKNGRCQFGPCSSAANLVMGHAAQQISAIAMMN